MVVASNTSPISNLAIIGRLQLLRSQFGELWIPQAVDRELNQLHHGDAVKDIQAALRERWIKVRPVASHSIAQLLEASLDPGEAEAIALAVDIPADLILLDEREGRAAAENAGLRVTGVLGVLPRAKKNGHVASFASELDALRTPARFFVSPALAARLVAEAGE